MKNLRLIISSSFAFLLLTGSVFSLDCPDYKESLDDYVQYRFSQKNRNFLQGIVIKKYLLPSHKEKFCIATVEGVFLVSDDDIIFKSRVPSNVELPEYPTEWVNVRPWILPLDFSGGFGGVFSDGKAGVHTIFGARWLHPVLPFIPEKLYFSTNILARINTLDKPADTKSDYEFEWLIGAGLPFYDIKGLIFMYWELAGGLSYERLTTEYFLIENLTGIFVPSFVMSIKLFKRMRLDLDLGAFFKPDTIKWEIGVRPSLMVRYIL